MDLPPLPCTLFYPLHSYYSYHPWGSLGRVRAGAIIHAGSQEPREALDTWFVSAFNELESPNSSCLVVGEWFWNRRAPYRGALIAHIWSSFCEWHLFTAMSGRDNQHFPMFILVIAWGVVLQFVPALSGVSLSSLSFQAGNLMLVVLGFRTTLIFTW